MSTILAIKKNGRIYMAADTQMSCGEKKYTVLNTYDRKIHKLDNGILLGFSGRVKGAQTVCAYSEIFTVPTDGAMTKKHIVQNIIPKLRSLYLKYGLMDKMDDEPDRMSTAILLAYKDKLFEISDVFATVVIEHYDAIGSGARIAMAGLRALDAEPELDGETINKRLVDILRISASHTRSVDAPFFLIDTQDLTYRLIE